MIYTYPQIPLTTESLMKTAIYVSGSLPYDREDAVILCSTSQATEEMAIWSGRVMSIAQILIIWIPCLNQRWPLLDLGMALVDRRPLIVGMENGCPFKNMVISRTAMNRPDAVVFESNEKQAVSQIDAIINRRSNK